MLKQSIIAALVLMTGVAHASDITSGTYTFDGDETTRAFTCSAGEVILQDYTSISGPLRVEVDGCSFVDIDTAGDHAGVTMSYTLPNPETTRYEEPIRVSTTFPAFIGSHAIYGCTTTGRTARSLDDGSRIPLVQIHTRLGKRVDGRPHAQFEYQNVPSPDQCNVSTSELLEILEHKDPLAFQNAEEDREVHVRSHSYNIWGSNFGYRIEVYDNKRNHRYGGDDMEEILNQVTQQHLAVDRNAVAAQLDREKKRVDYYNKAKVVFISPRDRWLSGEGLYLLRFQRGSNRFWLTGSSVDNFIDRLSQHGVAQDKFDEDEIRPQIERDFQRIRNYYRLD